MQNKKQKRRQGYHDWRIRDNCIWCLHKNTKCSFWIEKYRTTMEFVLIVRQHKNTQFNKQWSGCLVIWNWNTSYSFNEEGQKVVVACKKNRSLGISLVIVYNHDILSSRCEFVCFKVGSPLFYSTTRRCSLSHRFAHFWALRGGVIKLLYSTLCRIHIWNTHLQITRFEEKKNLYMRRAFQHEVLWQL